MRQALAQPEAEPSAHKRMIDEAVDRFLPWKLPEHFSPDSFITFDGGKHDTWGGYPKSWPTGTNLFTAEQARTMFEHCLTHPVNDEALLRECLAVFSASYGDDLEYDEAYEISVIEKLRARLGGYMTTPTPLPVRAMVFDGLNTYTEAQLQAYRAAEYRRAIEDAAKVCDAQARGWVTSPSTLPDAGFIASNNCGMFIRALGETK